MSKLSVLYSNKEKPSKELTREEIKQALQDKYACYVLVTCSAPCEKGEMQVELSYDGEESLASYLLESAQSILKKSEDFYET